MACQRPIRKWSVPNSTSKLKLEEGDELRSRSSPSTPMSMATNQRVYAIIEYGDPYVQPLIIAALARLPSDLLVLIKDVSELPSPASRLFQWCQYESIDFDRLLQDVKTSLANSYIIRKALIRKHYLSATVEQWMAKNPDSVLRRHVQPSVDFEVDYAEFLDDALVEAWELKASWERNGVVGTGEREWWILKPGMSDRGQGIRLFSSEAELKEIFEGWDPDEEDDEQEEGDAGGDVSEKDGDASGDGIMTSQLRHFVAQPYIHPPLLLDSPHPAAGRKFHIRTYVLAVGALKVYVYRPMLALFAAEPYTPPSATEDPNADLSKHLTNTCLQTGERDGSVELFWSLPQNVDKESIFAQICNITSAMFEAAARSMSIHFQPLPNAFEIFGVDFMVDAQGTAWLLEVNSFPDFAQTGDELKDLVQGLMDGVVDVAVRPFIGMNLDRERGDGAVESGRMQRVLDIDLGRR